MFFAGARRSPFPNFSPKGWDPVKGLVIDAGFYNLEKKSTGFFPNSGMNFYQNEKIV
jgi:hypothetical protein